MRLIVFDNIKKKKYQPKPIARLWGGYNGNRIPDDIKTFFHKHVKTGTNGKQYVNQYPDSWYYSVFKNYSHITDFDSFFSVISPYFSVQRKQDL